MNDEWSSGLPIDEEAERVLAPQRAASAHPERYDLGKDHPDRAKQFKPFAALRGYEEVVARVMAEAAEPHDFTPPDDAC